MEEKKCNKNYLTIDICKGFLHIGKGVVRSLDKPDFISLMINEEKKILAIMAADKEGLMTFKVPDRYFELHNKNFRIHSKGFVGIMADLMNVEGKEARIKLSGRYDPDMDAVVFNLENTRKMPK